MNFTDDVIGSNYLGQILFTQTHTTFQVINNTCGVIADESKVGQKLMEKMGWSKGKGLGANEQGDVDHISVKFKDKEDVRGVGFEGHDATWIAHQVGKIPGF